MDKIAVLIPCYNEEKTIQKVVEDFGRALPEATIYVYDNCSTDQTSEIVRNTREKVHNPVIIRKEQIKGKGNVIRRMFREIDAECYVMTDGDDTYPAEAAPSMVKKVLEEQVDMVVGDRLSSTYFSENKRLFHNFGNYIVRSFINHMFKSDIKDVMTGYRALSYNFVKTYPVLSGGFEIETDMTIHAVDKKMLVSNIIIEYRDRPEGSESKLNTYSDGVKVISTIIKLYKNYRPFHFFSVIAGMLFLVAIILFVPVFIDYIHSGLVERFPTLIICGFCVTAALMSFFSGLVLSTIVQKDRQNFEIKLNYFEKMNRNDKCDVSDNVE